MLQKDTVFMGTWEQGLGVGIFRLPLAQTLPSLCSPFAPSTPEILINVLFVLYTNGLVLVSFLVSVTNPLTTYRARSRKSRLEMGPPPSNLCPTAEPCLLKVPEPSETMPPTRDHKFRDTGL